jgi:hypothetical protein
MQPQLLRELGKDHKQADIDLPDLRYEAISLADDIHAVNIKAQAMPPA